MLLSLIISAWTLALSSAAPTQVLYTAPVVRYQPSIIQPIVSSAPNPVFVYQGLPYSYQLRQGPPGINNTQISEIIGIFQDAGAQAQGTFQQLQEWGQSWGQSFGQGWGSSNNERLPASTMELKPMLNERFDIQPNIELLNPEMKTKIAAPGIQQKQYYTIAGYPQLYYDFVQPAYSPVLNVQPVQAIRARSMADPNPALNDQFLAQVVPGVAPVSVAEPIVPGVSVPLAEPLKSFVVPELPLAEPVVDVQPEQQPIVAVEPAVQAAISYAKSLQADSRVSSRSQSDEPNKLNDIVETVKQGEAGNVAQASPVAAAVAGKLGNAEAAPIATAIAGKDGLAIAQPVASAVAGEFGSSEKKLIEEKIAETVAKDKVE